MSLEWRKKKTGLYIYDIFGAHSSHNFDACAHVCDQWNAVIFMFLKYNIQNKMELIVADKYAVEFELYYAIKSHWFNLCGERVFWFGNTISNSRDDRKWFPCHGKIKFEFVGFFGWFFIFSFSNALHWCDILKKTSFYRDKFKTKQKSCFIFIFFIHFSVHILYSLKQKTNT